MTAASPIKEKASVDDKLAIMDIVARADDSRQLTIEIQVTDEHKWKRHYYWATFFASQLRKGVLYEGLKKTIGISILDYRLWEQTEKYHPQFMPLGKSEWVQLTYSAPRCQDTLLLKIS